MEILATYTSTAVDTTTVICILGGIAGALWYIKLSAEEDDFYGR